VSAAEIERCPGCAGASWETLFVSRGYRIARCAACRLVRTLGAAEGSAVEYPPFEQTESVGQRLLRAAVGQLYRERLACVRRLVPSGRLLDFGCGAGGFARLMAQAGYDVVGVEPFSLGRPTSGPRLRLLRAPLADCGPELGQFDVITLWQVLEHVRDPGAVLGALLAHLRPGATLLVSVPNFASWQSRAFGPGWFHLDAPRHVTHFERATLDALLDHHGLEPFAERTFHLEYGPAGWLQSVLNRVALRRNFLYELVKDRGALADLSRGEVGLNLAFSTLLGAALAAPVVAVEGLAALGGAGAVLTVAARRRDGR
jgi:SAM-dependent methyltransferase